MKAIIFALLILGPAALTYAVGYVTGHKRDPARLNRGEKKELEAQRDLIHDLEAQAYQNYNLPGESFPTIVIDEINKTRRQIR